MMIGLGDRRKQLQAKWSKLPLARKFIISGGFITLCCMVVCSVVTTAFLTQVVMTRSVEVVSATAQSMLSPSIDNLTSDGHLPQDDIDRLDTMTRDAAFSREFPFVDLWLADGTIVYSNTPGLTNSRIEPPPEIERAFQGELVANFSDTGSSDYLAHGLKNNYLDLYFPLHDKLTGEIVAVAQLRETTSGLQRDLWSLTISSWLTIAALCIAVLLALFSIVLEGSRTIERQGRVLSRRLAQSRARSAHLRELKAAAQRTSRSVTELTDKYLRTVGTDLHDGPAQSIAFAVLRLDQIRHQRKLADRNAVVGHIEEVLGGALMEIRAIANALVLPDIESLELTEVIERAVQQHVLRTNTNIAVDSVAHPVRIAPEIAVCVFRFIQEGLNNAFRHGLPDGQSLSVVMQSGLLKLSITNNYLETASPIRSNHNGIGLYGLRARVNSLSGVLIFKQDNGKTRLEMWLDNV